METTEQLFERLEGKLDRLLEIIADTKPRDERRWYSTAEFAIQTGLTQQSISRYCSQGRLKAIRSEARRGNRKEWRLPATEVRRYKEEGLLPAR